ncbi:MAG: AAA family ATPase [Candidatus Lokiarchaeota archaeon]|nr:AAA family ATPase [Candidatus Lokiarchaeota archaeon]
MKNKNPFSSTSTVFKDASTFDQGWIPDWRTNPLPCRNDEINSLTALFKPVLTQNGKYCVNALILGRGGVGKTITSKYFGRIFRDAAMEQDMSMLAEYVDCNEHSTRNAILRSVLSKLKLSTGRGYSDPELMKQLVAFLKNNNHYLFLILDEVHKLEPDDLLSFINASITFGSHNVRMSFLCSSRSQDWLRYGTERLTSRIQKVYTFKPYNTEECYEILKYRNQLAFYSETFSDDILKMVAEISADEKNMRTGIEILRQVALHLDENNNKVATAEMIRKAGGNTISNYNTDLLNYLSSEHEYLVLLAVARFFKYHDKTYITTKEINEQYDIVSEEYGIKPLKFATLKRYIKRIEDFRLLSKTFALPEGKKRGRESRYSLNSFSAELLEEQLTKMLDNLYP